MATFPRTRLNPFGRHAWGTAPFGPSPFEDGGDGAPPDFLVDFGLPGYGLRKKKKPKFSYLDWWLNEQQRLREERHENRKQAEKRRIEVNRLQLLENQKRERELIDAEIRRRIREQEQFQEAERVRFELMRENEDEEAIILALY